MENTNIKKCPICDKYNSFNKRESICKKCSYIKNLKINRTKKGLLKRIYYEQRHSSKLRNHIMPSYSIEEFIETYIENITFNKLYYEWVKSEYDKWLKPSFDRKNDSLSYSFSNFNNWVTWKENKLKFEIAMRNGEIIHKKNPQKKVAQYSFDGELIKIHTSINQASRSMGKKNNASYIKRVCDSKSKYAYGFKWKYYIL